MASFVFVHGGGQGGWVWDETIAALKAQDASVVTLALDAAGCGSKRARAVDGLTVRDVAEELAGDLAASALTDVVLVGHSNAGTLLPVIAAREGARLRRIVYVSCVAPAPGVTLLEDLRPDGTAPAEGDMAPLFRHMFCNDMDPDEADAFMAKLMRDAWPTVAALAERERDYAHLAAIPATYIQCLRDVAVPLDLQSIYAERLHCDRTLRIDAGHQVMNTRPHALAEALRHEAAVG